MNGDLIQDQALQIREVIEALNKRHVSYEEAKRLIRNSAKAILKMIDKE